MNLDATQQKLFTRIQYEGNIQTQHIAKPAVPFEKDTIKYWVLVAIVECGRRENNQYIINGWKDISTYHPILRASWSQRFQELAQQGIIEYSLKNRQKSIYIIKNIGKIVKLIAGMGDHKSIRFNKMKERYLPQD